MERAHEENYWDYVMQDDVVEGPVERVTRKEVVEAIKKIKRGKAAGLSEITTEMIMASGKIGEDVMMQLYQRVLEGNGPQMSGRPVWCCQYSKEKEM